MRHALGLWLVVCACSFASSAAARAPDTFDEDYHPPVAVDSPQWFGFELRLGPYRAGESQAFQSVFAGDKGLMLNAEIDITVLHLPKKVGQVNVAGGFGWAKFEAHAYGSDGVTREGEKTRLVLFPMYAVGVLRIDALARMTVVPLTFAAKVGYETVRWTTETGGKSDGDGFNHGLRWGAQTAFELDFFDRGTARRLDEDWGVNHTYVLFEYYESLTEGTGDRTFNLGIGAQF
jgi:hypothetical protein